MPHGFKWDPRILRQKLEELARTTKLHESSGHGTEKWFAGFGRLETHLPRKLSAGNGHGGYTNGFGHESASPAQLVFSRNAWFELKDH